MSARAKIVKEYLSKFPKSGDATIARKIFKENKIAFDHEEQVRSIVRYHRGHFGNKKRHAANDFKKPVTYDSNPYKLPESEAAERKPFVLPKACNNILVISDLHIPYHDVAAITAAIEYGKKNKINCILINGDLIDFYQLSRFEKDPRKRRVKEEFDAPRAAFTGANIPFTIKWPWLINSLPAFTSCLSSSSFIFNSFRRSLFSNW